MGPLYSILEDSFNQVYFFPPLGAMLGSDEFDNQIFILGFAT
jgi:hypothetical protein